jgi:hypothetical protein
VVGVLVLYVLLKDNSILNSLKELETDLGVSYYASLFAAIMFIIMGVSLIINFFQ